MTATIIGVAIGATSLLVAIRMGYVGGFRLRVRGVLDDNNVLRVVLVNRGRLEGEVVAVILRDQDKRELGRLRPPDDRRIKSRSTQSWWAQLDEHVDEGLRVEIRPGTGRRRIRRVHRVDGLHHETPLEIPELDTC